MKFDMHCHTREGSLDGKVSVEDYVRALKEKGFDGMLVSDHNSYDGYRAWERSGGKGTKPFVVLKGIEYDTADAGHILVILPESVKLPILELRGLSVRRLIEIVHGHGGILGPAHPCGRKNLGILNTGRYRNCLSVMDRFDFLEGFNACEPPESNRRALEIADRLGLPAFGGSDAHKEDCIGLGFTDFSEEVTCESELIGLLKRKGSGACVCGGTRYLHTVRERFGKGNGILMWSYWVYNRLGGLWNFRKRSRELKKLSAGSGTGIEKSGKSGKKRIRSGKNQGKNRKRLIFIKN